MPVEASEKIKMENSLRIIYMGTPEFAVAPLQQLVEQKCNIVAVITAVDKPAGRGQKLNFSAVKEYALTQNIPILQPESLKNEAFLEELASYKADLQIVVAFRMLPKVVWNMPSKGTFNLHASLLPQYRGAAPINWAIINGDKETGVTTFFIEEQIDTGNIIFQEKVTILPEDNIGTLYEKLMSIGANLVIKTVRAIEANEIKPIPQADIPIENLKPAPKINKETCKIDWNCDAETIHNLVRGFSPYPAAWTELILYDEKTTIKIFSTTVENTSQMLTPGTIITDSKHYLKVACGKGSINITDLQPAGKKRMDASSFLNGHKIKDEEKFN
jgi:methionyl-tRNA formyltransferase